jgi:hypothetical protein
VVVGFLYDLLIAVVFPINIGGAIAFSIYSTIPKSAVARWAIIVGGALGMAVLWLGLFQDPNSDTNAFVLAFIATLIAAFFETALLTWVLRYKVGWSTPFKS